MSLNGSRAPPLQNKPRLCAGSRSLPPVRGSPAPVPSASPLYRLDTSALAAIDHSLLGHSFSVCAVQPILVAIDMIAAQCDAGPCS